MFEIIATVLIFVLVVGGVCYFFIAMYEWNLYIGDWGKQSRFGFTFGTLAASGLLCIVYFNDNDD